MINIEGTAPLPPTRLAELVTAILSAEPEDECDWAEWKSSLDLTSKPGQFALARAILGFANRDPETSQRPFAGTAYVVVGAEPGNLVGVTPVDLAVLLPRLTRYLGSPAPFWRHHYVTSSERPDQNVLVIEVPAPRIGEPIYALASAGVAEGPRETTTPSGTIFTRRGSQTERANYNEIQMLTRRATAAPVQKKISDLRLAPAINLDTELRTLDLSAAAIDHWLDQRRLELLKHTEAYGNRPERSVSASSAAELQAYSRSVDAYLEQCRPYLEGAFTAAFFHQGFNSLGVILHNSSDEHLADVEVVLKMPSSCFVVDYSQLTLATLPRTVDHRPLSELLNPGALHLAPEPRHAKVTASASCISNGTHSTYVDSLGTIRPDSGSHTCSFGLFIDRSVTELEIELSVTSPSIPGRTSGTVTIPVVRTGAELLAEIIDPDPTVTAIPGRRLPMVHRHGA